MTQGSVPPTPELRLQGMAHVHVAFGVGSAIDLDRVSRLVREETLRPGLGASMRVPRAFDFVPRPLEILLPISAFDLERCTRAIESSPARPDPVARLTLFDFGAVSVEIRYVVDHALDDLIGLSASFADCATLQAVARGFVDRLCSAIAPALDGFSIAVETEQAVFFDLARCEPATTIDTWIHEPVHRHALARLLRCEREPLSEQQIETALQRRAQYRPDDLVVVDWDVALLFGGSNEDERAVLEFANVELLELRLLDRRLDGDLDEAWERLRGAGWFLRSDNLLNRVSQLQVDGTRSFEAVENALVLFGDQYLATVHGLARDSYGLGELAAGILRKLERLREIYGIFAGRAAHRRALMLESLVVILIAVEIAINW